MSLELAEKGSVASSRKRRRGRLNENENRFAWALFLTQLGELSSAKHALEASPLAPGDESTRAKLIDESRRPSKPTTRLDRDILEMKPEEPFHKVRSQRKLFAASGWEDQLHYKNLMEGQGHCCGRCLPSGGRKDHSPAVLEVGRGSHPPVPIRVVNEGGNGMCHPHGPSLNQ